MSHNISHIFYINLEKRQDRRTEIENELMTHDLSHKAERFNALTHAEGWIGCTMSHLAVLKLAKERNYPNVLILEDDFEFLITKEEMEEKLGKFFDSGIQYDVLKISYNVIRSEEVLDKPFIRKIIESQAASGYIVNNHYYDSLIKIFEEAVLLGDKTKKHWIYINDQIWKKLQPTGNWFYFTKRFGKQRPGYSDLSNVYRENDW